MLENSATVGAHGQNDLHAEALHRGEGGLALGETAKHLLIKVQLELGIHIGKGFIQHGEKAPFCGGQRGKKIENASEIGNIIHYTMGWGEKVGRNL